MTREEFKKLSEELKMNICREIAYEYAVFVPKNEPRAITKLKSMVYLSDKKFLENNVLESTEGSKISPYNVMVEKIEKMVENYYRKFGFNVNVQNILSSYGEKGSEFKTHFEECLESSKNNTKEAVQKELSRQLFKGNDVKSTIKGVGEVISRRETSLRSLLESLARQMEQFMILCECHKNGFTNYRIKTNDDNCKVCTALDGKIFSVSDAKLGKNIPPFHPNCDCSIEVLNEAGNTVFAIGKKDGNEEKHADLLKYFHNPPVNYINWNGLEKYSDKEVLSREDYEQIQMLTAIFNYAKYVLEDDSIADEAHRKAIAIRQQDKYSWKSGYGPVHGAATSNELQFANLEGAVDKYNYNDSKAKVIIQISKPLSAFTAQTTTNEWINYGDEAGAFGMVAEMFGISPDVGDFIGMILSKLNEKLNPLFGKVCEGDTVVYVEKTQPLKFKKEYSFFFSEKNKKDFYYVKK